MIVEFGCYACAVVYSRDLMVQDDEKAVRGDRGESGWRDER